MKKGKQEAARAEEWSREEGGGGRQCGLRNSSPRGKGDEKKDKSRGWRVKDQP